MIWRQVTDFEGAVREITEQGSPAASNFRRMNSPANRDLRGQATG